MYQNGNLNVAQLPQINKAAAAFEKCGFISAQSFNTKEPRGHNKKGAVSAKQPRFVPGFIARAQQTRSGFRTMRLYFSTAFQHKTTEWSQKKKPLFQQQSRDPCLASLCACNKPAAAFEKCGFISVRCFNTKQPGGHKK
jgi:hypothetical protein